MQIASNHFRYSHSYNLIFVVSDYKKWPACPIHLCIIYAAQSRGLTLPAPVREITPSVPVTVFSDSAISSSAQSFGQASLQTGQVVYTKPAFQSSNQAYSASSVAASLGKRACASI